MAIRYKSIETPELEEMLADLVRQLGNGVATVSYQGTTTTYSSPAQIRIAIAEFESELIRRTRAAAGLKSTQPIIRVCYARTGNGL